MRVVAVVLTVVLLSGCAQEVPSAPAVRPATAPPTTSPSFLDVVDEPGPQPSIAEQAAEAQKRNEGVAEERIRRNNLGQPARTKRDHAEDAKRAP